MQVIKMCMRCRRLLSALATVVAHVSDMHVASATTLELPVVWRSESCLLNVMTNLPTRFRFGDRQ